MGDRPVLWEHGERLLSNRAECGVLRPVPGSLCTIN